MGRVKSRNPVGGAAPGRRSLRDSTTYAGTMPAVRGNQPLYSKDDRVLCFHGELLYEAKVLETKLSVPSDPSSSHMYLVHYKGWKSTWDDWVSIERIRKFTEENKELAKTLNRELLQTTKKPSTTLTVKSHTKKRGLHSDDSSHASDERQNSLPATSRTKRGRDDLEKEEDFYSRPEVRITMPDLLKNILVDDWEHVTKNLLLVTLPAKKNVTSILNEYWEEERMQRPKDSAEYDILEEIIAGTKEYFNKALGRILLYTFERPQYADLRSQWIHKDNMGAADVYGGEHLLRLMVKLPELIGQTNMDQPSCKKLRQELIKLNSFLAKNADDYFPSDYAPASPEYIGKARTN